jgi:hypothetical protein
LQSAEDEVARLQERLQLQEEENNQRLQLQEEENNQRFQVQEEEFEEALHKERYGTSWNGKTTDASIIDNLTRLSPLAVHYNANVTNQFIRDIPEMLWWQKILEPFLDLEDLSILRRTNTFFQSYWESVLRQNVIRVPQGCPTVEKAMALAEVFSEKKEYTGADPLKIRLEEGVHEIVGDRHGHMKVTCSHITFVGKGSDHTTVRGGFRVTNKQNVKFQELTITNPFAEGLFLTGTGAMGGGATVEALKSTIKGCKHTGVYVNRHSTFTATECKFTENTGDAVYCMHANTKVRLNDCTIHQNGRDGVHTQGAVVDLHGTKTKIHSNERCGIWANLDARVNIHLPSQHNTSHGNVGEDRHQFNGGSIANINADGTFTHVVVEEEDDDDDDDDL